MSLVIAIPAGLAAAAAYGVATAIQHDVAYTGTGKANAAKLVDLARNRRWLLSIGGDAIGLAMQVIAQATGPIVIIQPLMILAVVVALPVAWRLGGPRPNRSDAWSCVAVLAGLATFFGLVGNPGEGHEMNHLVAACLVAGSIVAAGAALMALHHRSAPIKAVVIGSIAGGLFGVVGVQLNQVALAWEDHGISGLWIDRGWLSSIGLLVVGGAAMALTQISFQIGELGASFPANQAGAPIVAVVLGAVFMHERLPLDAWLVVIYVGCVLAIIYGTVRLARVHNRSGRPLMDGGIAPLALVPVKPDAAAG